MCILLYLHLEAQEFQVLSRDFFMFHTIALNILAHKSLQHCLDWWRIRISSRLLEMRRLCRHNFGNNRHVWESGNYASILR